jgi:hypothetical protein
LYLCHISCIIRRSYIAMPRQADFTIGQEPKQFTIAQAFIKY